MAPSQTQIKNHCHPDQIPKISRLGGSKAQLCLQKILHIILTVPESNNDRTPTRDGEVPTTKVEEEDTTTQSPASAVYGGEASIEEETPVDPVVNKESDVDRSNGGAGGGDCMGLLIQAATLIFGGINEENDEKTATETATGSGIRTAVNVKRRSNVGWTVDLYGEMEPVVRSKRGGLRFSPASIETPSLNR